MARALARMSFLRPNEFLETKWTVAGVGGCKHSSSAASESACTSFGEHYNGLTSDLIGENQDPPGVRSNRRDSLTPLEIDSHSRRTCPWP